MPKAKATIVADTPEMKRLASNTKIQSNVQYHAEFEANKAKFTSVTDDPESKRLAANQQTISNISYHGLVEKKEEEEKKRSVISDEPPSVPKVGESIHHFQRLDFSNFSGSNRRKCPNCLLSPTYFPIHHEYSVVRFKVGGTKD